MLKRPSFRQLLETRRSLVMPAAHDALTARLIEMAGFDAFAVSGSALLAARHALPDLGIAGLADMVEATRDILSAVSLPCLGDGDDGYGDVKSVARTVRENEAIGLGALVLEDQARVAKQPGQAAAHAIVDEEEIAAKIRVAAQSRHDADFWIIGRTDAYATLGVAGAMKRAELFLRNGADGIFIAGVKTEADIVKVAENFRSVPKILVMYGGEEWPGLPVSDIEALGYSFIVYPLALILPYCLTVADILAEVKQATDRGDAPPSLVQEDRARTLLSGAVGMQQWTTLTGTRQ